MLRLDERLDKQLKLIISFRPEIMHQTGRAFNAIYNAKPDTPTYGLQKEIFPVTTATGSLLSATAPLSTKVSI